MTEEELAKHDSKTLLQLLLSADARIDALTAQVAEAREQRADAEARMETAEVERDALRERVARLEADKIKALALEAELQHRAEKTDKLLSLANSMDADFQRYAEAHPTLLRITGPNSDGEYWLHIKSNGRSGGVNLGTEHGPICKRLLDVASETGAALKGETP